MLKEQVAKDKLLFNLIRNELEAIIWRVLNNERLDRDQEITEKYALTLDEFSDTILKKISPQILNLFKAEVDKLTVIGVMEMPPILEKIMKPHNIPNTAENYDYLWTERVVLVKAQLQDTKKQLLGGMG
ncbi:MAG TPA: hypothetical protein VMW45_03720 [Dehalococcoidia bacterium]|nr:hypothetical protein [Dehalococcoidia bacterium]